MILTFCPQYISLRKLFSFFFDILSIPTIYLQLLILKYVFFVSKGKYICETHFIFSEKLLVQTEKPILKPTYQHTFKLQGNTKKNAAQE